MARILVSTPLLPEALAPLASHELIAGEPGSDAQSEALLVAPGQGVDAAAQERMPKLRAIAVAGAGTDAVDEAAATARGVALISAGEPLVETTAELAFGLILAASRLIRDCDAALRAGRWEGLRFMESSPAGAGEEPRVSFGRELHGTRLGLVGHGRIARAVVWIGAYWFCSWIVASVRLPRGSSCVLTTVPTDTPATRTSDCGASCCAFGNATSNRYPCGLNGIVPPNESHRNSNRPAHESANSTIVMTLNVEGGRVSIAQFTGSFGWNIGVVELALRPWVSTSARREARFDSYCL